MHYHQTFYALSHAQDLINRVRIAAYSNLFRNGAYGDCLFNLYHCCDFPMQVFLPLSLR